MSGRHRKPTASSISVAKIAVTGAVIGGGAVGLAGQAQAAPDSEWDVVAACESSGNWAINTGNGYQGGLQFSPSTWLGYGGGQFASAANLASKDEQIAIAEKVLAGQGRGAWPVCGRGLSGPTPRDVSMKTTKTPAQTKTPAPATTHSTDAAATVAPLDNPLPEVPLVPQDAPAPADLAPVDTPDAPAVVSDAPEAPAPAPAPEAPAPGAPAPAEQVAPQPEIISISEKVDSTDQPMTIETALIGPASDAVAASTALPEGVAHLSGTSTDPGAAPSSTNVSYLKDLWHAVQNQEIDRDDLLMLLAQRQAT